MSTAITAHFTLEEIMHFIMLNDLSDRHRAIMTAIDRFRDNGLLRGARITIGPADLYQEIKLDPVYPPPMRLHQKPSPAPKTEIKKLVEKPARKKAPYRKKSRFSEQQIAAYAKRKADGETVYTMAFEANVPTSELGAAINNYNEENASMRKIEVTQKELISSAHVNSINVALIDGKIRYGGKTIGLETLCDLVNAARKTAKLPLYQIKAGV